MSQQRFGDVLRRFVPISRHDIEEVLQEQAGEPAHRKFGEIALSMGLCEPQHVWQAWCHQLSHHVERVNLAEIGIDSQATMHVSRAVAREYRAVPVRCLDEQIVIAVDEASHARAAKDLPGLIKMQMHFVIADSKQIDDALNQYYPAASEPVDRAINAA
jgi:hypothetical protein